MTKIIFLDANQVFNTNKNFKIIENPLESINLIEKNKNKPLNTNIEKLYNYLMNSLNYQSEINAFPSTLPDEINIKFTNLNIWENLNPFNNKSVAKKLINKSITITYFFLKEKPLLYHTDYFFL